MVKAWGVGAVGNVIGGNRREKGKGRACPILNPSGESGIPCLSPMLRTDSLHPAVRGSWKSS